MGNLPEIASRGWDKMDGPAVLTTVSREGAANSVYVTSIKKYSEDKIVIVDHVFEKTRRNILDGSPGVFLFITKPDLSLGEKNGKAYQIKGRLEYLKEGEIAEDAKKWAPPEYPFVAAVVLRVEEVYCGADKLL